jgi:hypothetical protein
VVSHAGIEPPRVETSSLMMVAIRQEVRRWPQLISLQEGHYGLVVEGRILAMHRALHA